MVDASGAAGGRAVWPRPSAARRVDNRASFHRLANFERITVYRQWAAITSPTPLSGIKR